MKNFWGAHTDREQELNDNARYEEHQNFLCEGAPFCAYCLEEKEEAERESKNIDGLVSHVNNELDKEQK